jgi:hypothetical protein
VTGRLTAVTKCHISACPTVLRVPPFGASLVDRLQRAAADRSTSLSMTDQEFVLSAEPRTSATRVGRQVLLETCAAVALAACGGGGTANRAPVGNAFALSGIVAFDKVPSTASGLNYAGTVARPIRGAEIQVVDAANLNTVLAAGVTGNDGSYSLSWPTSGAGSVRIVFLARTSSPRMERDELHEPRGGALCRAGRRLTSGAGVPGCTAHGLVPRAPHQLERKQCIGGAAGQRDAGAGVGRPAAPGRAAEIEISKGVAVLRTPAQMHLHGPAPS